MLDFPRWKVWLISLTVIAGVLLSIPSFIPEDRTPAALRGLPRIALGLDLSGGSHIMLEASPQEIVQAELANMERSIGDAMRQRPRISIGDVSTQGGRISFMVRDVRDVDAVRERILPLTTGVGVTGQRNFTIEVVDSTRFVITLTNAGREAAIEKAMEVATEIVRTRIDELGTREPTIIRQGDTRIVVQVPGLQNPEALKDLLGQTAKLEFKLVDLTADPAQLAAGRAPIGSQILPSAEGTGPVAVKRSAIITGEQLADAQQAFDPQTGEPVVTIRFDSQGGRRFARVTQENVGRPFAIILDGTVLSAPRINEPILGGTAQISGSFTVESANNLAIALRSGALPVELRIVEERTVGPELGADSIRTGTIACIIAVAAVMGFMFMTYGSFGIYANLALVLNVLMIVGIMALFNSALTLPGLAGMVLTIGAAVDANVLINERIREELRRGRRVADAVNHGFEEARVAIFDANTTNVIAGLLMFYFGSGPIRGFAVVLMIGIVTSFFTAVTVTRMLVALWLRRKRPRELVL